MSAADSVCRAAAVPVHCLSTLVHLRTSFRRRGYQASGFECKHFLCHSSNFILELWKSSHWPKVNQAAKGKRPSPSLRAGSPHGLSRSRQGLATNLAAVPANADRPRPAGSDIGTNPPMAKAKGDVPRLAWQHPFLGPNSPPFSPGRRCANGAEDWTRATAKRLPILLMSWTRARAVMPTDIERDPTGFLPPIRATGAAACLDRRSPSIL